MMIILGKFSKRHYRRQITTYLLACCLFLSLLPSVAVPGPKGKALGHSNLHGNGPFPTTHGRVNPAGIKSAAEASKSMGSRQGSNLAMPQIHTEQLLSAQLTARLILPATTSFLVSLAVILFLY